jgi:hypothetical protein
MIETRRIFASGAELAAGLAADVAGWLTSAISGQSLGDQHQNHFLLRCLR